VGAARGAIAAVIGADVVVLAVEGSSRNTLPVGTLVVHRARVVVAARFFVGFKEAANGWVAGIVGAGVQVVANNGLNAPAFPAAAGITDSAVVTVRTGGLVVPIGAARIGVARVVRADVAIIAIEGTSADTDSTGAKVGGGARVAVVAR